MYTRMRTSPRRAAVLSSALVVPLAILTACGADVSGKATDNVAASESQVRTVYVTQTVQVTPSATPEIVAPAEMKVPVTPESAVPAATYTAPATTLRPRATVAEAPTPGSLSKSNAKAKASEYLEFSSFSRSGLIDQLEYSQFSTDDATYAVDSSNVDWNEQAAKKAQEYLDFSSFSRAGLKDQLMYSGFTPEQAEYGVSQTGL